LGALLGRVAAVAEAQGPQAALHLLDALPEAAVKEHQPYWPVRAHLLRQLGRTQAADTARYRALTLAEDEAVRVFLLRSSQH
jgi:RNA polymerase sigma-70 factor (ECF subfamily)